MDGAEDAEPYHIQLALLLLGATGAATNAFPDDHRQPLPGEPTSIELNWRIGGKEKRSRAEEFVYDLQSKSVMSRGVITRRRECVYLPAALEIHDLSALLREAGL